VVKFDRRTSDIEPKKNQDVLPFYYKSNPMSRNTGVSAIIAEINKDIIHPRKIS